MTDVFAIWNGNGTSLSVNPLKCDGSFTLSFWCPAPGSAGSHHLLVRALPHQREQHGPPGEAAAHSDRHARHHVDPN